MKPIIISSVVCAVLALGAGFASFAPATSSDVGVGDAPQYTWRTPLVNGMGVTSLDDLRGKPVLLDFWGVH